MVAIAALSAAAAASAQVVELQMREHTGSPYSVRAILPQRFYRSAPQPLRPVVRPTGDLPPVAPGAPVATETADPLAPYVTYCVRSCDGFYFPLRQNATRDDFPADAARCASSCDGQASLFYAPLNGGGPQTMIDLAGRKYADAPNALAYRKTFQTGCNCKPPPWSVQAAARHRAYARAAFVEEARRKVARLLRGPDQERESAQFLAPSLTALPAAAPDLLSTSEPAVAPSAQFRAAKFKIRPAPPRDRYATSNAWRAVTR